MTKKNKKPKTLSIFVFDPVSVSEEMVRVEIIIFKISDNDISFNAKEIAKLREVLRPLIGKRIDGLPDEDLSEFGGSMLRATAIVLKAQYLRRKSTN